MKKAFSKIEMRTATFFAGLVFFLFLCLAQALGESSQDNLTLMIYLCGSDLETQYGSATEDLQEIIQACEKNPCVTVLAMAGGSIGWKAGSIGSEDTVILEISSGRKQRILEHCGDMNMGDPETLSAFLRYSAEKQPASQYALILWDHGGGPMEGVCFDERSGMDSLSLNELTEALENSPFAARGLAWIGFDACLMASLETARCCEHFAEYMIASQETEPGSGWNYAFLKDIQPGETAEKTGRRIVGAYMEGKKESDMLTISLVDLDSIPDLERAANRFFQKTSDYLTEDSFSDLSRGRLNTKGFGRASTGSDYDLADLYHLSELYAFAVPEEAKTLQSRLDASVVISAGNQENAFGLSVYYPYYNRQRFIEKWQKEYREFDFLSSYRSFLNRYSSIWMEEPLITWPHLAGTAGLLTEQGTQALELELTEAQVSHFAEATCQILEEQGTEGLFYNIYTVPKTTLEGNTLKAEYDFQALYAVDDRGIIETAPIPFIIRDGYYLIYAFLQEQSLISDSSSSDSITVILQCRRNETSQELEIINIIPADEEKQFNLGRQSVTIDTDRWKFISLNALKPFVVTKDRDGSLLPFDQWSIAPENLMMFDINYIDRDGNQINKIDSAFTFQEESMPDGAHLKFEADLTRPWKLKFMPVRTNGKMLSAQFTIRDTQGNEWGSDLISLSAPDVISSSQVDCLSMEIEGCRIQPIEIKTIRNDQFKGLCVRLRVSNESENTLWMYVMDPEINGMSSPEVVVIPETVIYPGWECTADILIDLTRLPYLEDSVIRHVGFLPVLTQLGTGKPHTIALKRFEIEAELDISGIKATPNVAIEKPLGSCKLHEVTAELIRLEEEENGILSGTIYLKNESEGFRRFIFTKEKSGNDTYTVFGLNDLLLADCTDVQNMILLQPGGEGYYDFQIVSGPDRKIRVCNENSEDGKDDPAAREPEKPRPRERRIKQVLVCGFRAAIQENVSSSLSVPDDVSQSEWIRIPLNRPFFVQNPFDVVFEPDSNEQ